MTAEQLTTYLQEEIPLTRAMGLEVAVIDGKGVRVRAPLGPNINHQDTAFGGSIAIVGILAGWSMLHVLLKEAGVEGRIVIQQSDLNYQRPITEALEAICERPTGATWDLFLETLQRGGMARLPLRSELYCKGKIAATHDGLYVASVG